MLFEHNNIAPPGLSHGSRGCSPGSAGGYIMIGQPPACLSRPAMWVRARAGAPQREVSLEGDVMVWTGRTGIP